MTVEEIRLEKLKALIDKAGSIVTVANKCDTSAAYLSQILNEVKSSSGNPRSVGAKLARKIEVSFNMPHGWMDDSFNTDLKLIESSSETVVDISLLSAVASMGNGNEIENSEVVVDVLRLKKDWVDKNIHPTHIKNLSFIHAIGSSMSPTLNDGDILLIDSGIKTITSDCIYVLEAHNRLFVKSVRQTINGQYEIYSDNPAVKTVDILNGNHEVSVLGRVVWVWNGKKV